VVAASRQTLPSVVNISTERLVPVVDPFHAYFAEFFGRQPPIRKEAVPLGSGVIIDRCGLILTNYHVVYRGTRLSVRLADGSLYPADRLAVDPANDLALLLIRAPAAGPEFQPVAFGIPDDLLLGETLIAVGNPFGLENTVSVGVLSARNRTLAEGDHVFNDILQTDAAINPGNSGGPLVNGDGQLVGINLAIRRDAEGIGFAIPLRRIEAVLASWLRPERVATAWCGLLPETTLTDLRHTRAAIARVTPGGPAAAAGLTAGDVVLRANGTPVTRAIELSRLLWRLRRGDRLQLDLADGRRVSFTLPEMPDDVLIRERLGMELQELTPTLLRAMNLPANLASRGLVLSSLAADCPAAALGAQRGDLLLAANDGPITSLGDFAQALRRASRDGGLHLTLLKIQVRNGQALARQYSISIPFP
jgi:serine protease Do